MKRLMLVWAIILCLIPLGGWAAEETASALYPIRENGLWGYMNRAGEVMIEPQWISAEAFSDGWAIVEAEDGMGLICTSGMYAIQPSDSIRIEEYDRRSGEEYTLTAAGLWCGRSDDHETPDAGLGDDPVPGAAGRMGRGRNIGTSVPGYGGKRKVGLYQPQR